MKMILDHQNNTINGFLRQNARKRGITHGITHITHVPSFIWLKWYFCLFDLEIYFLTLKMTLTMIEVLHLFLASFVEKAYLTLKY